MPRRQSDETLFVGIKKRIWRHKNRVCPQHNRVSEGSFDLGGLDALRLHGVLNHFALEPSPRAETMRSSTTICADCLVTRPKSPE